MALFVCLSVSRSPPLSRAAHAHLAFEARWAFGVPQKAIAAAAIAVPLIMKLERDCHFYRTLRVLLSPSRVDQCNNFLSQSQVAEVLTFNS